MITQLELQFFKCFELLRLPLAPFTLLTGPNASGKSSVLQALVLLHQTMREHEWSTRLALNGDSIRMGAMPDVVDEEFGRNSFRVALETEEGVCDWTFEGDRRDMSMRVESVTVNGRTSEQPEALRYLMPPAERQATVSFARYMRNLTYITAERLAPQETYELEDPHLVTTVGTRGEHAVGLLHWSRDESILEALVLPDVPPRLLHQVQARMRTLFPGCTLDLQQAQQANAVTLGLSMSESQAFHRPIHTGFGLTQILPIIVAILSASENDVVLIENPEVHLHPAGQALMGQLLADVARAGVQVLVETHSDHVLNGIRRAVRTKRLSPEQVAIHFFRPRSGDDTQVLSPALDASGNLDHWPEGFFDQFDKDASYFAGWADD